MVHTFSPRGRGRGISEFKARIVKATQRNPISKQNKTILEIPKGKAQAAREVGGTILQCRRAFTWAQMCPFS